MRDTSGIYEVWAIFDAAFEKQVPTTPAKKAKKAAAKKTEDSNAVAANSITETDNHATNRAPISSAPQDIIDVGSATLDARKRGWWSRGE